MTDTLTVTFAAQTQNVALARSIAATMAARADLTLDRLEDLRLAVDEAVTEAIVAAAAEADITIVFTHTDDTLIIEVSVPSEPGTTPLWASIGASAPYRWMNGRCSGSAAMPCATWLQSDPRADQHRSAAVEAMEPVSRIHPRFASRGVASARRSP